MNVSIVAIATSPRRAHGRYWWHESTPDVVGDRYALVGGPPGREDPGLVPRAVGARVGDRLRGAQRAVPHVRYRRLAQRYVTATDRLRPDRVRVLRAGDGADLLPGGTRR